MNQSDYGTNVEFIKSSEGSVRPLPSFRLRSMGRARLPEEWMPKRLDTQASEEIKIRHSANVSTAVELFKVFVLNAVDGAFHPAPQFET